LASTIFFSWQSDTPQLTGRNFIERALKCAIDQLAADVELKEAARELKVDRDTKGVPGSPKIVDTIFSKIDAAEAFIGDVSFVGRRPNRDPIPNPNVLIEYGWALKSLSHDRVLTLMNTAYGNPDPATLPFDMRHVRHPIAYHLPDDATPEQIKEVRAVLAKTLAAALRDILKIAKTPPMPPPAFRPLPSGSSPGRFRTAEAPLAYAENPFSQLAPIAVTLAPGPVSWLRLMPAIDPGRTWSFSELKAAATADGGLMMPYGVGGGQADIGYLRDADGFGTRVMTVPDKAECVSFLFQTGEVWGIDAFVMGSGNIMIEQQSMVFALTQYRNVLKELGISGPYRWIAGFEGTKGRALAPTSAGPSFRRGTALVNVIQAEGELLDDQGPDAAIGQFVKKVYDACGFAAPA
jgi:hypothetical protein